MVLLQHKLSVKLSQRQILTPGLVQMVSVLALNKLELKDMITAEMVENPVLEELEDSVPLLDEVGRREEERDRPAAEDTPVTPEEKKDPFEEIDFGSFFKDYLDPGYRSPGEMEDIERPSFENFLSKPSNLTDHLTWQLGAMPVTSQVREAAELIIGNLNEDGYLIASDDELMGIEPPAPPELDAAVQEKVVKEAAALGAAGATEEAASTDELADEVEPGDDLNLTTPQWSAQVGESRAGMVAAVAPAPEKDSEPLPAVHAAASSDVSTAPLITQNHHATYKPGFTFSDLHEAL